MEGISCIWNETFSFSRLLIHSRIDFPEMEAPAAVTLVQNHNATAISVDYRLAPEHLYSYGLDDTANFEYKGRLKAIPAKH